MSFGRVSDKLSFWLATPTASIVTAVVIVCDLAAGAVLGWGGAWGNVNGAATGIIGVALLVLLSSSTYRSIAAILLKMDQLILVEERIDNRFVGSEDLPEVDLRAMKKEALDQVHGVVRDAVEHKSATR